MGRKLGAVPLFGGSWVPIWHNVAGADAYLRAKFHLDPSNRFATIHERHRQTDRTDRQRTDSRGRMAAPKLDVLAFVWLNFQRGVVQWFQVVQILWYTGTGSTRCSSWWKTLLPVVSVLKFQVDFAGSQVLQTPQVRNCGISSFGARPYWSIYSDFTKVLEKVMTNMTNFVRGCRSSLLYQLNVLCGRAYFTVFLLSITPWKLLLLLPNSIRQNCEQLVSAESTKHLLVGMALLDCLDISSDYIEFLAQCSFLISFFCNSGIFFFGVIQVICLWHIPSSISATFVAVVLFRHKLDQCSSSWTLPQTPAWKPQVQLECL